MQLALVRRNELLLESSQRHVAPRTSQRGTTQRRVATPRHAGDASPPGGTNAPPSRSVSCTEAAAPRLASTLSRSVSEGATRAPQAAASTAVGASTVVGARAAVDDDEADADADADAEAEAEAEAEA